MKVKFNTLSARLNFRNINRTSFGLTYSPEIRFNVFSGRFNNSENNTHIHLPVNKTVGNLFEVAMAVTADVTNYTAGTKNAVSNSYFVFSPSVLYRKSNVNIHAGIKPSWDSEGVKVFPNVMTEFSSVDNQLTVQAGWIGHMRKNSYQYLAGMNPWMWAPERITTSRITELYGGVKGTVTDHFTYGAKIGFDKFTNQPLFINDTNTGSSFIHLIEPSMKAINFTGEVGYNVGEKFSFLTSLKLNRYFDFEVNAKAWGLVPLELRSAMRLQVMRDLYVKGDLYAFNPPWHLTKSGNSRQSKGAMDLSAGLEFAVVKNVKLWAQFNNILNNEYERWHQYPVYGFNFMGGVILSLAQNFK
ncbi:MAG: hypothetical protein H0U39_06340 [Segetibacter sp.]|nr:hypothetical protein [Segetibacter sp.]